MNVKWPDDNKHCKALEEKGVSKESVVVENNRLHAKLHQDYWEIEINRLVDLLLCRRQAKSR
jgi:hypothetical protein